MFDRFWTVGAALVLFGELLAMQRRAYLKTVLKHKWYVLEAGLHLGGIPLSRLLLHDMSKLLPETFEAYRKQFYSLTSNERKENEANFQRARRSHWVNNKHHWKYWTDLGEPMRGASHIICVVPMPEEYVREMVADWIAAIKENGEVDLQSWLNEAYCTMWLHEDTVEILRKVLAEINVFLPDPSN